MSTQTVPFHERGEVQQDRQIHLDAKAGEEIGLLTLIWSMSIIGPEDRA